MYPVMFDLIYEYKNSSSDKRLLQSNSTYPLRWFDEAVIECFCAEHKICCG